MFVDASALLTILLGEPEADRFIDALQSADPLYTSPIALFETVTGLRSKRPMPLAVAEERVHRLLATASITVVSITDEIGRLALDAHDQYGKGRHRAQLNMGDCFAYACAKAHRVRILYKGDDFSRTDLA
jgi:ribonuclease VapC